MQNNECRQLAHLITYKDMAKYEYNNATFFYHTIRTNSCRQACVDACLSSPVARNVLCDSVSVGHAVYVHWTHG